MLIETKRHQVGKGKYSASPVKKYAKTVLESSFKQYFAKERALLYHT
jgi:hypothetical protein